MLGISAHRDAYAKLEDYHKGRRLWVDSLGGPQEMATLSEAGLYRLILRSDKPAARFFERWVTTEVLPQIRKSGTYRGRNFRLLDGPRSVPAIGGGSPGRPPRWKASDMLALLKPGPLRWLQWCKTAHAVHGIAESTFADVSRQLTTRGFVTRTPEGVFSLTTADYDPAAVDALPREGKGTAP